MQPRLSSPFHLRERLRKPDFRIGIVPLASVLLVAFFLFAMTSKFIFAPGITVEISPEKSGSVPVQEKSFALPVITGPLEGKATNAVISVRSDAMFIFDGKIFRDVETALPPAANAAPGSRGVLLVRMNKNTSIQVLFSLAEAAREAGFSAIQIAGESAGSR